MSRGSSNWRPRVQVPPAPSSRRLNPVQVTVPIRRQAWEREITVPRAVAVQRRRAAAKPVRPYPDQTPRRDAVHIAAR